MAIELKNIEDIKKDLTKFRSKHRMVSIILVATAVILIWRGIWALADTFLFPNNPYLSAVASLVIGFAMLFLLEIDLGKALS